jgi:hypothetical protein
MLLGVHRRACEELEQAPAAPDDGTGAGAGAGAGAGGGQERSGVAVEGAHRAGGGALAAPDGGADMDAGADAGVGASRGRGTPESDGSARRRSWRGSGAGPAGEAGLAEGRVGGDEQLPAWRHVSMLEPADFDAKVPPDLLHKIDPLIKDEWIDRQVSGPQRVPGRGGARVGRR